MAALIGVDSLAFISIDGLYRAVGEARRDNGAPQFCDACFSGDYPIPLTDKEPAWAAARATSSPRPSRVRAAWQKVRRKGPLPDPLP